MPRAESDPLADIHLEKLKLTGRFGARVEVDAAAFTTTGNLTGFDDGVQLRRLRLVAEGDALLLVPFRYKIELGYVPNQFNLQQAYLEFSKIDYVGSLRFGQFQPPMGLQVVTSSWDIPLMEPAAPLQAIAPGIEAGVQVGKPFDGERATFQLGVFGPGAGPSEYGNASERYGSLIGRLTGLPIDQVDPDDPSSTTAAPCRVEPRRPVFRREHRALPVPPGELHRSLRHRHGRHRRERIGDGRCRSLVGERAAQPPGGVPPFLGRANRRRAVELRRVLRSRELVSDRREPPLRPGEGRLLACRSEEELRVRQDGMGRVRGGGPLLLHGPDATATSRAAASACS